MDERELKQCTKRFALRVMKLAGALPENIEGRVIGSQLMRCATRKSARSKQQIANQKL